MRFQVHWLMLVMVSLGCGPAGSPPPALMLPPGAKIEKKEAMDFAEEFGIHFSYSGPLTTKQVVEYVFFKNRPRVMAGGVVTRNHVAERGDWHISVTTGDATFSVSSSVYYREYYTTLYADK